MATKIDPCSVSLNECVIEVCRERFDGQGSLGQDLEYGLRERPIPPAPFHLLPALEHVLKGRVSAFDMHRWHSPIGKPINRPWFSYPKLQQAEQTRLPEQQVAFRRGVANDLLDANPDMCKPPSVTVAALNPQASGVAAHQRSITEPVSFALDLPEAPIASAVAYGMLMGVRGKPFSISIPVGPSPSQAVVLTGAAALLVTGAVMLALSPVGI